MCARLLKLNYSKLWDFFITSLSLQLKKKIQSINVYFRKLVFFPNLLSNNQIYFLILPQSVFCVMTYQHYYDKSTTISQREIFSIYLPVPLLEDMKLGDILLGVQKKIQDSNKNEIWFLIRYVDRDWEKFTSQQHYYLHK